MQVSVHSDVNLNNSFSYHMQYYHGKRVTVPFETHLTSATGISSKTSIPFSPPIEFRTTPRPDAGTKERKQVIEGKCHVCRKWVPLEGVKDVEVLVKELYWHVDLASSLLYKSLNHRILGGSMPLPATRALPWRGNVTTSPMMRCMRRFNSILPYRNPVTTTKIPSQLTHRPH